MIEKKVTLMLVLALIQLVCMTIVVICENNMIDYCIISFQGLILLVQFLIMMLDIYKSNKKNL